MASVAFNKNNKKKKTEFLAIVGRQKEVFNFFLQWIPKRFDRSHVSCKIFCNLLKTNHYKS